MDDFAQAITSLSKDVVNSSRRFLSIMKMSSIEMGGYELDATNGFLFVTDNFFHLFNMDDVSVHGMTPADFLHHLTQISQLSVEETEGAGELYAVTGKDGTVRYIHMQETFIETRRIGVAEDVTIQTLERRHIEHERDYDLLTGIYNRRAFFRDAGALLGRPEQLGTAVVVMLDLDNLKGVNDSYGHEWGDRYIVAGSKCILSNVPASSVVARVSGDEFTMLLYGFDNEDSARAAVARLRTGFQDSRFVLPDGREQPIGASGGMAFVGQHSNDLKELVKYADFAMYQVKHGVKGHFAEFDSSQYHASELQQHKRVIFRRVLAQERVRYVFQPIVSVQTGTIHAYEALMRLTDAEISSVEEFLRLARLENAQVEVERLTWFSALAGFRQLIRTGEVSSEAKIFINSQVGHTLGAAEQELLIERFGELRDKTVMEVLETEDYSA